MYPRVVLTLSYTGGPTGYYVYEIPMACHQRRAVRQRVVGGVDDEGDAR